MNILKKFFTKLLWGLLLIIYLVSNIGISDKLGSIFKLSGFLQTLLFIIFMTIQFALGLVAKYKKSNLLNIIFLLSLIIPLIIGPYIVFCSLISLYSYIIILTIFLILICAMFYFSKILPQYRLNNILIKQKNPELYISEVEKLMLHSKDEKEKYDWYLKKVRALVMQKKFKESIDILQEVEFDKLENLNQLNYYIFSIECYLNTADFEVVNHILNKFITFKSESKKLQVVHVNALLYFLTLMERFDEAKEQYNKNCSILYNNSIEEIKTAVKDTIATYKYYCGNIDESKKMFLELDDENEQDYNKKESVNYFLGLIFLSEGKEIDAKKRFEKVLENGNGYFYNKVIENYMNVINEDERYYYDHHTFNIEKDEDGNIDIDRVYRLDYEKFTELTWNKLGEIYRLLPQYIDKENCCPMWYGDCELPDDEGDDVEFYLCASVEPPGIQIAGHLKYEDWIEWEKIFHEHIFALPYREW